MEQKYDQQDEKIQITGAEVLLPEDLSLNAEETKVLEKLKERLRKRVDERECGQDEKIKDETDSSSERSSTEFTMVPSRSDGEARSHSGSTHGGL